MYSEEDKELLHSKYRFKDCVQLFEDTVSDGEVYFGQGDYHIVHRCKVDKLKWLNVRAPNAEFACPRYCPSYQPCQNEHKRKVKGELQGSKKDR